METGMWPCGPRNSCGAHVVLMWCYIMLCHVGKAILAAMRGLQSKIHALENENENLKVYTLLKSA
eukprot:1368995-Amorphochlora_amoeboformis.AAC.1